MYGNGVQNAMKALWTRQFASTIPIDPYHAEMFDRMTTRMFRDFKSFV